MAKTKTFGALDIYLASFLSLHDQKLISKLRYSNNLVGFMETSGNNQLMKPLNVGEYTSFNDLTRTTGIVRRDILPTNNLTESMLER
jgi:CHASE2 domain-containing sensor protein